jgi:small subunit ribosomal protein S2
MGWLFEVMEAQQIGGFTMSEQTKGLGTTPVTVQKDEMAQVINQTGEPIISMKKLAAAGVQYGHQMRKWNPKMAKYIYTSDRGIHIVDLKKTVVKIEEAYKKLKEIVANNGKILFVGTKKQIQDIVKEQSLRSGSFFINRRWLGGTLTNFKTILNRIRYLKDLEKQQEDGNFNLRPKKEINQLKKVAEKLNRNLEGIKEIRLLPKAVFVVDPIIDHNAVAEAKKLKIPVFAITDTNCDPDIVDYAIPGNDDAVGSVRIIVELIADAIVKAKGGQTVVAYVKDDVYLERLNAMKEIARPTVTPVAAPVVATPTPTVVQTPVVEKVLVKEKTDHSDKPAIAAVSEEKKPAPRKKKIDVKETKE